MEHRAMESGIHETITVPVTLDNIVTKGISQFDVAKYIATPIVNEWVELVSITSVFEFDEGEGLYEQYFEEDFPLDRYYNLPDPIVVNFTHKGRPIVSVTILPETRVVEVCGLFDALSVLECVFETTSPLDDDLWFQDNYNINTGIRPDGTLKQTYGDSISAVLAAHFGNMMYHINSPDINLPETS